MPKFTVVTACKNAVRYIDETVESVLQQSVFRSGQCELEYLIYDGASIDGTLERLRAYESRGVKLVSEPDSGVYAALAKGLQKASGDYVAYLNAGDLLYPTGLGIAAECFELPGVDWVTGYSVLCNERLELTRCWLPLRYKKSLIQCGAYGPMLPFVQQESTAWRRALHASVDFEFFGGLRYAGDAYLWRCFSTLAELCVVRGQIGGFRIHKGQLSENRRDYTREMRSFCRPMTLIDYLRCAIERFLQALPGPICSRIADRSMLIMFDHARQVWRKAPRMEP